MLVYQCGANLCKHIAHRVANYNKKRPDAHSLETHRYEAALLLFRVQFFEFVWHLVLALFVFFSVIASGLDSLILDSSL